MGKGLEKTFLQRRLKNGAKVHEKWSMSLLIREMQIKNTIRHHCASIRMAASKKTANTKFWQECGEIEAHLAGGNVKWCVHFGTQFGSISKCKLCPSNSTPSNGPRKMTYVHIKTHT